MQLKCFQSSKIGSVSRQNDQTGRKLPFGSEDPLLNERRAGQNSVRVTYERQC